MHSFAKPLPSPAHHQQASSPLTHILSAHPHPHTHSHRQHHRTPSQPHASISTSATAMPALTMNAAAPTFFPSARSVFFDSDADLDLSNLRLDCGAESLKGSLLVDALPSTPPYFQPHKRSLSHTLVHNHRHYPSTDSTISFVSAMTSPRSSPAPYSPSSNTDKSEELSPRSLTSHPMQLAILHDNDRESDSRPRRMSDSLSHSAYPFTTPPSQSQSQASLALSLEPVAPSPERLQALINVVCHMESSGQQQKFLSQLGILYKQMYGHLFVKGMLKDLVDYAVHHGLLRLTGAAGQQQVHLTPKARMSNITSLPYSNAMLPPAMQAVMSPMPSPSPIGSPCDSPVSMTSAEHDDNDVPCMHAALSRHRSSSSNSVTSATTVTHTRHSSLSFTTPVRSPMAMVGNGTMSPMPSLSLSQPLSLPPTVSAFFAQLSQQLGVSSQALSMEEKSFKNERVRHLHYIYHFRVHSCKQHTSTSGSKGKGVSTNSASSNSATDCFDYHSAKMRRRVPHIQHYANGTFWSYNACRCQAIEKEVKCEKGEQCRYAHNKEEIAYHPSRYKTQLCSYPVRPDTGVCTRFGIHCAYAHGDDDLRKPIVLKQGSPQGKLFVDGDANGSAREATPIRRLSASLSTDGENSAGDSDSHTAIDDYVTPRKSLVNDRLWFVYHYKIHPCTEPSSLCATGSCHNFHHTNKRRRDPSVYHYSAEACPSVRPTGDAGSVWRQPTLCPSGDDCHYSHTLLESMYHPHSYKTVHCANFADRKCQWGRTCSHAHSQYELEFNLACAKHGEPKLDCGAKPVNPVNNTIAAELSDDSDCTGLYYRDGKPRNLDSLLAAPLRLSVDSDDSSSLDTHSDSRLELQRRLASQSMELIAVRQSLKEEHAKNAELRARVAELEHKQAMEAQVKQLQAMVEIMKTQITAIAAANPTA